MIGVAWTMKSPNESGTPGSPEPGFQWYSAFVPMRMPTGLPSIVPVEPTFVAITLMRTNGVGRSFRVSQTWKTSARTKTMEVTSSTMPGMMPERSIRIAMNLRPVIFFALMIDWMIHVKKPMSLRAPTSVIMPTSSRMMCSSVLWTNSESVRTLSASSAEMPMKATPRRRSSNISVAQMMSVKTETAAIWRSESSRAGSAAEARSP